MYSPIYRQNTGARSPIHHTENRKKKLIRKNGIKKEIAKKEILKNEGF